MKRKFFTFLFVFTFSFLFADFNDGAITKFVEFDLASSTTRGIEREARLFAGQAGLRAHWFEAAAGIQGYEDAFDVTISGAAWLPFANWYFDTTRIALGCGGLYHFQRYKDISSEHDYIFTTNFRYQSMSGTTITFWGGYFGKSTRVDELAEYVSMIHDHYPAVGLLIDKVFSNGFELYFCHATHDFYRFPVFCSPSYTIGGAINLDSGLRFGGEVEIRFVDQYTTAPYCDSLILRMTARFSF